MITSLLQSVFPLKVSFLHCFGLACCLRSTLGYFPPNFSKLLLCDPFHPQSPLQEKKEKKEKLVQLVKDRNQAHQNQQVTIYIFRKVLTFFSGDAQNLSILHIL